MDIQTYMSGLQILGKSPDFEVRLPPCAIFTQDSPDLRVISLKSNKIICYSSYGHVQAN